MTDDAEIRENVAKVTYRGKPQSLQAQKERTFRAGGHSAPVTEHSNTVSYFGTSVSELKTPSRKVDQG